MVLIGLVSSGKSTLANALIGRLAMPTSNLACTAIAVTVADPIGGEALPAAMYASGDEMIAVDEKDVFSALKEWNLSGGGEFCLRMPLPGLNHGQFPMAIMDTPGVNNGLSRQYRNMAFDALRRLANPTAVFVSHVRSCGTDDEERCLCELSEVVRERKLRTWFFILNGWDLIDPEADSQADYTDKIRRMAKKCGLPVPKIYFVAALPAELCLRAMRGEELSGKNLNILEGHLDSYHLMDRAWQDRRTCGRISDKTLRLAARYCGITSLECGLYDHFRQRGRDGGTDENV